MPLPIPSIHRLSQPSNAPQDGFFAIAGRGRQRCDQSHQHDDDRDLVFPLEAAYEKTIATWPLPPPVSRYGEPG